MKWIMPVFCVVALFMTVPSTVASVNCGACLADLNCDGVVDDVDLNLVLACWGTIPAGACASADVNGDGKIDGIDLGIVLGAYGTSCP